MTAQTTDRMSEYADSVSQLRSLAFGVHSKSVTVDDNGETHNWGHTLAGSRAILTSDRDGQAELFISNMSWRMAKALNGLLTADFGAKAKATETAGTVVTLATDHNGRGPGAFVRLGDYKYFTTDTRRVLGALEAGGLGKRAGYFRRIARWSLDRITL
jgi:hypothetical protein